MPRDLDELNRLFRPIIEKGRVDRDREEAAEEERNARVQAFFRSIVANRKPSAQQLKEAKNTLHLPPEPA